MGMAHWTVEECRYFVDVIVPQSKYANGDHDENALRKSFGDLAKQMQDAMDAIGVNKRKYTQSNMFQHYYQKPMHPLHLLQVPHPMVAQVLLLLERSVRRT
ncbi:hypothetical protein BGZ60DRAFT_405380 [Tricladium varicosporioides]|nr:hypothetical protein BGZ60DRAFT_405380 [Hymenoscyphus varicosporioides]